MKATTSKRPIRYGSTIYAGVLAVAIGGASLARFCSGGMVRAMLATAVCQVMVVVLAPTTGAADVAN